MHSIEATKRLIQHFFFNLKIRVKIQEKIKFLIYSIIGFIIVLGKKCIYIQYRTSIATLRDHQYTVIVFSIDYAPSLCRLRRIPKRPLVLPDWVMRVEGGWTFTVLSSSRSLWMCSTGPHNVTGHGPASPPGSPSHLFFFFWLGVFFMSIGMCVPFPSTWNGAATHTKGSLSLFFSPSSRLPGATLAPLYV